MQNNDILYVIQMLKKNDIPHSNQSIQQQAILNLNNDF